MSVRTLPVAAIPQATSFDSMGHLLTPYTQAMHIWHAPLLQVPFTGPSGVIVRCYVEIALPRRGVLAGLSITHQRDPEGIGFCHLFLLTTSDLLAARLLFTIVVLSCVAAPLPLNIFCALSPDRVHFYLLPETSTSSLT